MNESELPQEGTPLPEEQPVAPPGSESAPVEDVLDAMSETVEQGTAATEAAAEEAEVIAEAPVADLPAEAPDVAPEAEETPASEPAPQPAQPATRTLTERLAEESEFDPDASSDDRLLAALSYASQLIIPVLVPIILLISETTKKRPFQRYHAVQSLAVGVVLWVLQIALGVLASMAVATFIGILCLCFVVPAMIAVWLLPLYYGILAYNGKRFRVPGLTQFLEDQRWL